MENNLTCDCVILNYNDSVTVKKLVANIVDFKSISHILIVDNCSSDDSYAELSKIVKDRVNLIQTNKNGGYGYGNNYGVKFAKKHWNSKYVLIVNPDVVFSNETLERLLKIISSNQNVAAISPCQLDINRNIIKDIAWKCPSYFDYAFCETKIFRNKVDFYYPSEYFKNKDYVFVDCIPGSFLLVDSDLFLDVGGYDSDIFLYCEESTIALKFKEKNYKTILDLKTTYIHEHSVSINKSIKNERKKYRILCSSRLIVLKKYLSKNWFQYAVAFLVTWFEIFKRDVASKLLKH